MYMTRSLSLDPNGTSFTGGFTEFIRFVYHIFACWSISLLFAYTHDVRCVCLMGIKKLITQMDSYMNEKTF